MFERYPESRQLSGVFLEQLFQSCPLPLFIVYNLQLGIINFQYKNFRKAGCYRQAKRTTGNARTNQQIKKIRLAIIIASFLILVPLITIYLTNNFSFAKAFKLTSIIISIGIFTFSIANRFDKDYSDNIFVDAEINQRGQVILNCKPGFADTRPYCYNQSK